MTVIICGGGKPCGYNILLLGTQSAKYCISEQTLDKCPSVP